MRAANCECDHEKRDHRRTAYGPAGRSGWGECKVCLCKSYTRLAASDANLCSTELAAPMPVPLID
jgi:hypothetical protein